MLMSVYLTAGCGPTLYVADMLEAETRLEDARAANARFYAPYEYYSADAYLEKAREEAAEGEYEDAVRFAKTASAFGQRAFMRSQSKGAPMAEQGTR